MGEAKLTGRDDVVAAAKNGLSARRPVVLVGPSGIGKTAVLDAVARQLATSGQRVLRIAPTQAEHRIGFSALIGLLDQVDDDVLDRLPAPQRGALEIVMRRRSPPEDSAIDHLAVRLATLATLRAFTSPDQPVLFVIDDMQWVDAASAEVFAFVVRKREPHVGLLGAERSGGPDWSPTYLAFLRSADTVAVGPLNRRALRELLQQRFGSDFQAETIARVHRCSAGNPRYALELGAALRRLGRPLAPGEPLPIPRDLRREMKPRLAALTNPQRAVLLTAAATEHPSRQLLQQVHADRACDVVAILDKATADDLVKVEPAGEVVFTHPLLAATLYAQANAVTLRRVHAMLAEAMADPVGRARHAALASPRADADVAATLMAASTQARERGMPETAAELARLAAERTPASASDLIADRLLVAARHALDAGNRGHAEWLASTVLAAEAGRDHRVHAHLLLIDAAGQRVAHVGGLIEQALAAAEGSPWLEAPVWLCSAGQALSGGRQEDAVAGAERAAELAREAGDHQTETRALCVQAVAEISTANPRARKTVARALRDDTGAQEYWGPRLLAARLALIDDDLDTARAELVGLVQAAEDRGEISDLVGMLEPLVEAELRAGLGQQALERASKVLDIAETAGLDLAPALATAALAQACAGSTRLAREYAERGAEYARCDDDLPYVAKNLLATGVAAVVDADWEAAVAALSTARDTTLRLGITEPAMLRWQGDLAESLIGAGKLDEAIGLVRQCRPRADELGRRSVSAGLMRADALCQAEVGDPEEAARQLESPACQAVEFPIERGRNLLSLGMVRWRQRRRAAAREALSRAREVFEAAGSLPWAARAESVLTRVDTTQSVEESPAGLTTGERRVARLAADGATNREIASQLYVSVKTVEAHLSRVYAKLQVRSKAELARLHLESSDIARS